VAVATAASNGTLAGLRVIVVGAGEMGEGVVAALSDAAAAHALSTTSEIVIANRSRARADALAVQVGGRGIALRDLLAEVADADVVVTATAGDDVILTKDAIAGLMAGRSARPLVVVDAAMPRDVDPGVGAITGVSLSNLDDLRRFAESEMAARRAEVGRVNEIIDAELDRYYANARARSAAPVIASLRAHAEALRGAELEHFRARLERLDEEDRELVDVLSKRLVQKLLHEPTVQLKKSAGTNRGERLTETVRSLFDL
jgi:glutamyl-tRNA reductase